MEQYQNLLSKIMRQGTWTHDRTGVGTKKIFGHQMIFDLERSFPLVTTKHTSLKTISFELQWLLKGSSSIKFLQEKGVTIWDEWADSNGELGPVYGVQWRNWPTYDFFTEDEGTKTFTESQPIDQFAEVMTSLRDNPFSRRHIISAWNVGQLSEMKLPPCHAFVQWDVSEDNGVKYLSCQMYQRSADTFLGVPYNIACYALLTKLMAHCLGYTAKTFIHTLGDTHVYKNHMDQVFEVLRREPFPLPTLKVNSSMTTEKLLAGDFEMGVDFDLIDYVRHPAIKASVAV